MKYLYTLLALISCHLGAMELPNTDAQWTNTPAKDAMARFSREKIVLYNGKEYSATPIQHAYLELLRETSGKDSQFMWNDEGENSRGVRRFKLMHYMTKQYDLQVLLGFDEKDTTLSLYGKNYERMWQLADTNMLSTMKTMSVDVSHLLPKPKHTADQPHVDQPLAPVSKSLNNSTTLGLLSEMRKFIPRWLSHQTPSWLNRTNIAIVCLGGIAGLGLVKVVTPKVKEHLETVRELGNRLVLLSTDVACIVRLLPYIQLHPGIVNSIAKRTEVRNLSNALKIRPLI